MKRLFTLFAILVLFPGLAMAKPKEVAGPKLIGTFGSWRAYSTTEQSQPVCYMSLTARFPKNAKVHRSDATLTVTHRPGESTRDVISYAAGYNYKPLSDAEVTIGKQVYNLFTSQDTAWSRDAATDHKIAYAIRTAPSLTIVSTPSDKKMGAFTDKFALTGANDAYRAISKACGVDVPELPVPVKAKPAVKAKSPVKKK